jgi:hypothetical protein
MSTESVFAPLAFPSLPGQLRHIGLQEPGSHPFGPPGFRYRYATSRSVIDPPFDGVSAWRLADPCKRPARR